MNTRNNDSQHAILLYKNGKRQEALLILEQLHGSSELDSAGLVCLGSLYNDLKRYSDTISLCSGGGVEVEQDRQSCELLLATAYYHTDNFASAKKVITNMLSSDKSHKGALCLAGDISWKTSQYDAAEHFYNLSIVAGENSSSAHYMHGSALTIQGRTEEARAAFGRALVIDPKMSEAFWCKERLLPIIFSDESEIQISRDRYADGLNNLLEYSKSVGAGRELSLLKAIASSTNFYLQYQGMDDKELQLVYANIVAEITTSTFSKYLHDKASDVCDHKKIRVGYVSTYLRNHNGAVWLLGWLRERNVDEFETYCYYLSDVSDNKSGMYKECSDHYWQLPCTVSNLGQVIDKIINDEIDILVYPELGMDPLNFILASLRIAPVQCVGWGHPITTGLTTIDYWLSSSLMEPEDADDCYVEQLIRLPNIANNYSQDQKLLIESTLRGTKQRSDFGLPDDSFLFLCSQSLFKYLPQYDYLWAEIAKNTINVKFVFLAISSVYVVKKFMERIRKVFSDYGLRVEEHCVMLNRLPPDDYLILNTLVDAFLDNPPWSGNNTTLAAIDSALPVVSLPTGYMRGRHSYAILKMIGMDELIAKDSQQYVDLATMLVNDPDFRVRVTEELISKRDRLYDDVSCVSSLEEFYKTVV